MMLRSKMDKRIITLGILLFVQSIVSASLPPATSVKKTSALPKVSNSKIVINPSSKPGPSSSKSNLKPKSKGPSAATRPSTCLDEALLIKEPYTTSYMPRQSIEEINLAESLSLWRWQGNISYHLFNETRQNPRVSRYKVIDRKLYVDKSSTQTEHGKRVLFQEELLKVTVYLFPIPDMEFLIHFGDGCFPEKPVLTLCICLDHDNAGFSIPSYSDWIWSLGPTQMRSYHSCLRSRYPEKKRLPLAVWRGTSTGIASRLSKETCMQLARMQLHLLGRQHTDVLDAKLTHMVQRCGELLAPAFNDTAPAMHLEDYNRYCVILDLDSNTWSDRYASHLVHFPTPILKMASNYSGFTDHLFSRNGAVEHFSPDMSDLLSKARDLITDCLENGDFATGQALSFRSQATARLSLGHLGVIKAMAYALMNYRRLSLWDVDRSLKGFKPLDTTCCTHSSLPEELVKAVRQGPPRPDQLLAAEEARPLLTQSHFLSGRRQ